MRSLLLPQTDCIRFLYDNPIKIVVLPTETFVFSSEFANCDCTILLGNSSGNGDFGLTHIYCDNEIQI